VGHGRAAAIRSRPGGAPRPPSRSRVTRSRPSSRPPAGRPLPATDTSDGSLPPMTPPCCVCCARSRSACCSAPPRRSGLHRPRARHPLRLAARRARPVRRRRDEDGDPAAGRARHRRRSRAGHFLHRGWLTAGPDGSPPGRWRRAPRAHGQGGPAPGGSEVRVQRAGGVSREGRPGPCWELGEPLTTTGSGSPPVLGDGRRR
jgi:hypothetical protein